MFVIADGVAAQDRALPIRDVFKISRDEGVQFDYVTGIAENAPFENICIGGFNFEKRVFPLDASLVQNQDKPSFPKLLVRKFTEKQAEDLRKRAKEHFVRQGQKRVCVADYILLIKTTDYNPNASYSDQIREAEKKVLAQENRDESEKMRDAMISEQSKKVRR